LREFLRLWTVRANGRRGWRILVWGRRILPLVPPVPSDINSDCGDATSDRSNCNLLQPLFVRHGPPSNRSRAGPTVQGCSTLLTNVANMLQQQPYLQLLPFVVNCSKYCLRWSSCQGEVFKNFLAAITAFFWFFSKCVPSGHN